MFRIWKPSLYCANGGVQHGFLNHGLPRFWRTLKANNLASIDF